jgi:hypothetical protein
MRFSTLLALSILVFSQVALADHSLSDAMSMNKKIKNVVQSILAAVPNYECDTENSEQTVPLGYSDGEAYTQTAQCYAVGKNGLKDPDGVLKITYSWKNYKPGSLLSVRFGNID